MNDDRNLGRILVAPRLAALGFRHGFSLRDVPATDLARAVTAAADAAFAALREAKQVHGARVLAVEGDAAAAAARAEGSEEADALVSRVPGVAVAIKVADCVPIVVADTASGAVGAIHAGWRGLVAGVIGNGVAALNAHFDNSLGAVHAVHAVIGPCIGVCCFEVGEEVASEIARGTDESVVNRQRGRKPHVDLRRAARLKLLASGVPDDAIEDIAGCTRCDPMRFHSYRRDGANAGRHRIAIAVPVR